MGRYGSDYGDRYGWETAWGRGAWRYGRSSPRSPYDMELGRGRGFGGYGGYVGGAPGFGDRAYGGGYGEDYGPARRRGGGRGRGSWWEDLPPAGTGDADTIRAADIMTHNPEAVTPDTTVLEVARRMRDLDVGVIPVVDDADSFRLQGLVTDRDVALRAAAEGKDVKKTAVREIMSSQPQTVTENDHVRDVFSVMKRARVRRVPVTGADGRLVGIIAQADLAVNYAGLDLQRETEVEEVIERISEPARPRWGREGAPAPARARLGGRFPRDFDLPDRVRAGWRTLRREARERMGRHYDRDWR